MGSQRHAEAQTELARHERVRKGVHIGPGVKQDARIGSQDCRIEKSLPDQIDLFG